MNSYTIRDSERKLNKQFTLPLKNNVWIKKVICTKNYLIVDTVAGNIQIYNIQTSIEIPSNMIKGHILCDHLDDDMFTTTTSVDRVVGIRHECFVWKIVDDRVINMIDRNIPNVFPSSFGNTLTYIEKCEEKCEEKDESRNHSKSPVFYVRWSTNVREKLSPDRSKIIRLFSYNNNKYLSVVDSSSIPLELQLDIDRYVEDGELYTLYDNYARGACVDGDTLIVMDLTGIEFRNLYTGRLKRFYNIHEAGLHVGQIFSTPDRIIIVFPRKIITYDKNMVKILEKNNDTHPDDFFVVGNYLVELRGEGGAITVISIYTLETVFESRYVVSLNRSDGKIVVRIKNDFLQVWSLID